MSYYLAREGNTYGPYGEEQLLEMLEAGDVLPEELIHSDTLGDWVPIKEVFPETVTPSQKVAEMAPGTPLGPAMQVAPEDFYQSSPAAQGINFFYNPQSTFDDLSEKKEAVSELKTLIRPQASAYRPSGKFGVESAVLLPFGTALGISAGFLYSAIAFAGVAIVAFIIGLIYTVMASLTGWIVVFPIFTAIGLLAAYGAIFTAAGYGNGKAVKWASKIGRNRSALVAGLLAVLGSIGTLMVLRYTIGTLAGFVPIDFVAGMGEVLMRDVWYVWVLLGIGGAIAIFTAWGDAVDGIHDAKYCEDCKKYMERGKPKNISFGQIEYLQRLALNNDIVSIRKYIPQMKGGGPVEVNEFTCPSCGSGYLDADVFWNVSYPEGEGDLRYVTESWRAMSITLDPS